MNFAQFHTLRRALNDARSTAPATTTIADVTVYVDSRYRRPPQRCTGFSSDAMVEYAFGHTSWPDLFSYPSDSDDLAACEETLSLARALRNVDPLPDGVVERMLDLFVSYWRWVVVGLDPDGNHIRSTDWHPMPTSTEATR